MDAARAARPPRPVPGPRRRVVLTCVARRDAARRLSLAFGLLARAAPADRADTIGAPSRQPWPSEAQP